MMNRKRGRWIGVAAALVVVSVAGSGCLATTDGPGAAPPAGAAQAIVPVTIQGGQGRPTGARPMVDVRVGTSPPVSLLLDTGSTGLQIFAPMVNTGPGSGVQVTNQPDRITYAGGHRLTGVVATARVTIGSQATAHPVAFGLVQQASCVSAKPTCPTAGGVSAAVARGFYGILGIGMNKGPDGLANPILGMPGRLARTWSLSLHGTNGSLVLGAPTPPASTTAATLRLEPAGTVGTNRFWDDTVHLCVVIGSAGSCAPGLFDSGTFTMQLPEDRFPHVPTYGATKRVVAGTAVAVSVRGGRAPFWKFTTGTTKSADTVSIREGKSSLVNSGVQAFYAFAVTYDETFGTIAFVRAS